MVHVTGGFSSPSPSAPGSPRTLVGEGGAVSIQAAAATAIRRGLALERRKSCGIYIRVRSVRLMTIIRSTLYAPGIIPAWLIIEDVLRATVLAQGTRNSENTRVSVTAGPFTSRRYRARFARCFSFPPLFHFFSSALFFVRRHSRDARRKKSRAFAWVIRGDRGWPIARPVTKPFVSACFLADARDIHKSTHKPLPVCATRDSRDSRRSPPNGQFPFGKIAILNQRRH